MLEKKLEFLKAWSKVKESLATMFFYNTQKHLPKCYLGDIYYAYLGSNIGAEIDKKRPVLVFQTRRMIYSHLVVAIPITSKTKNSDFCVHFNSEDILKNAKFTGGTILVDQMRVISKQRLEKKIGVLCAKKITEVQSVIKKLLPI